MEKNNTQQYLSTKKRDKNIIVAKIIKSGYYSELLENKVCEFEHPDTTIDLFVVADESCYSLGTISKVYKSKKRKKEIVTIHTILTCVTFEIISCLKPIELYTTKRTERLNQIRDVFKNVLNKIFSIKNIITQHRSKKDEVYNNRCIIIDQKTGEEFYL